MAFALLPNSASCERVFSLIKSMFGEQQMSALADYIRADAQVQPAHSRLSVAECRQRRAFGAAELARRSRSLGLVARRSRVRLYECTSLLRVTL